MDSHEATTLRSRRSTPADDNGPAPLCCRSSHANQNLSRIHSSCQNGIAPRFSPMPRMRPALHRANTCAFPKRTAWLPGLLLGLLAMVFGCNGNKSQTSPPPNSPTPPAPTPVSGIDITTYHDDVGRTGLNANESILTPGNVAASTFGLLRVLAVDGKVDAQPSIFPISPLPAQSRTSSSRPRSTIAYTHSTPIPELSFGRPPFSAAARLPATITDAGRFRRKSALHLHRSSIATPEHMEPSLL